MESVSKILLHGEKNTKGNYVFLEVLASDDSEKLLCKYSRRVARLSAVRSTSLVGSGLKETWSVRRGAETARTGDFSVFLSWSKRKMSCVTLEGLIN